MEHVDTARKWLRGYQQRICIMYMDVIPKTQFLQEICPILSFHCLKEHQTKKSGLRYSTLTSFADIGNYRDFGVDNVVDLLNALNTLLDKPTLEELEGYQETVSLELNKQTLY